MVHDTSKHDCRRNHYPNPTSIDALPDGTAFIKSLGLSRVHVVAHSSGAHAALFFASNHPEMVRTLTVNEPPASGLIDTKQKVTAFRKEIDAATKFIPSWVKVAVTFESQGNHWRSVDCSPV